jgi:hypothetical protein
MNGPNAVSHCVIPIRPACRLADLSVIALRLYRRTRFSGAPPEVVCIGYVRVGARDLNVDGTYEKKLPLLAFLTSEVLGQVRLSMKSDQLNVKGSSTYTKITEVSSNLARRAKLELISHVTVPGDSIWRCQTYICSRGECIG